MSKNVDIEVGGTTSRKFDSDTVLQRLEKQGDLVAPVLTLKQRLPSLRSIG